MITIAIENKPNIYEMYLHIIEHYLNQNYSDSAILINGEWGSSKTFFVNSVLKEVWYSDKFCVEPHRTIEDIARNTVCHILLRGLYLAPLKLSEHQKFVDSM